MTRTSRALILAGAGAIALALATPGLALADDAAPTVSRGSATIQDPNGFYAGYTADLGAKKSISGTLTLPTLGDCSTDGGLLLAIELSDASGANYVDGGSYSYCEGGTKNHHLTIGSADGGVLIGHGNDGDKIKVDQKVLANGDVRVTVENLTQGSAPVTQVVTTDATIEIATGMHWGQIFVDGEPLPTLDYDKLNVKGVTVGAKTLKQTDPIKYNYVPGGDLVLKTSRIRNGTNYSTSNVS